MTIPGWGRARWCPGGIPGMTAMTGIAMGGGAGRWWGWLDGCPGGGGGPPIINGRCPWWGGPTSGGGGDPCWCKGKLGGTWGVKPTAGGKLPEPPLGGPGGQAIVTTGYWLFDRSDWGQQLNKWIRETSLGWRQGARQPCDHRGTSGRIWGERRFNRGKRHTKRP